MKPILASRYRRVFDDSSLWNASDSRQNPLFVTYIQTALNDLLHVRGYVFLNEALELLGFETTPEAEPDGWIRDVDPGEGDGRIDFGIWSEGFRRGRAWLHGDLDDMELYFNVDRTSVPMPVRIKKLREEGKLL